MHALSEVFQSRRPNYVALGRAFVPLLERVADEADVQVFRLESRTKEIDSLEGKVSREDKAGKYTCLEDITDLCGLRVVLFDTDACISFISVVRKHFDIDEKNSVDKSRELGDDQFGYQSTHLIVSLSEQRRGLLEYKDLVGLKAELQIRTVLQHAWSVLDHKLRYKSEIEAPKELRRKLFRISALLEAADEAFLEIRKASEVLRAGYDAEIASGQLEIAINRDSLTVFIERSEVLKDLISRCTVVGVPVTISLDGSTKVWTYLIKSLLIANIDSLDKLESALRSISDRELGTLKEIVENAPLIGLGIYTFLRDAVLTTAPRNEVVEVLKRVPSTGVLSSVEEAAFERLERFRQNANSEP